jgi:hypothetical protein
MNKRQRKKYRKRVQVVHVFDYVTPAVIDPAVVCVDPEAKTVTIVFSKPTRGTVYTMATPSPRKRSQRKGGPSQRANAKQCLTQTAKEVQALTLRAGVAKVETKVEEKP